MSLASRGFTILELLIVVLLLSMVASLAIPAFFHNADVTLENASVLLARDLRAAQNRSAYLAEPCRVFFYPDGDGYEVRDLTGRLVMNPRTGDDFERLYSIDGVFRGVEIQTVEAGPRGTIDYDSRGRALVGARVALTFQGDVRVVAVEKGSGKVVIEGSTSGWRDEGY